MAKRDLRLPRAWAAILLAVFAGFSPFRGQAEELTDCGETSLYFLLKSLGREVDLERLQQILPPRRADGFSMEELKQSAGKLGVDLEGRLLSDPEDPPKEPFIAFLKLATEGHYVVLSPVGKGGQLFQILDSPKLPRVVSYRSLMASRPWTGRCLVVDQPSSMNALLLGCLTLTTCLSVIAIFLLRSRAVNGPPSLIESV